MKYGLSFANGGPCGDARSLAELARLAEEAGWDGLFLEDYIVWQGHQDVPTYDPWVLLGAMALATERVRLGTMVTPLPRRRPWKVAREAVTLDHLSHGRMILGVGLGDMTIDISLTHFSEVTDTRQRARMLDESLDILAGLWSGQPFSYPGEHYRVADVTLLPRPVQAPRIPIWVGGTYPTRGPLRRAARWDGACLYRADNTEMTPADVRGIKEAIASLRGGTEGYDIAVGGFMRGPDWEKERAHIAAVAAAGATWWIEYLPPRTGKMAAMRRAVERGPLRIEG